MMFWLSSAAAVAGVPLVHDGDPAAAVAAAAGQTGLPPAQFTPVSLDELLRAPASVRGDAVLRPCVREPSTLTAVRADLARAEAAWAAGQALGAIDHLDLALSHLGCLSELADPAVAGRVFQLRAAVAVGGGQAEVALGEARTAASLAADVAWPEAFGAEGAASFAAAVAEPASVDLRLVPEGGPSGPWLDGALAGPGRAVRPGLHLLQTGGPGGLRSAWLAVEGDATVLLPMSFRRPVLDTIAGEADRGPLEALVLDGLPDVDAAYVAWGGGLWLVTRTDAGPSTAVVAAPPPPPPEGKKKRRDR